MLQSWTILAFGLAYLGMLFAVATWGDRLAKRRAAASPKPLIYAFSLGVYCTSWTYFGSVGIASRSGLDFLPIYIGPILVFVFGWRLLQSIAAIAKRHNIASIADFLAARYGKSEALGALVAAIAVIGIIPYISIQLKAVATSLQTLMVGPQGPDGIVPPILGSDHLAILVTVVMGIFAILFGTRHIDTTEHQDGMILAIAVESIVKLLAFAAVGLFATYWVMGGFGELAARAAERPDISQLFSKGLDGGRWLTLTLLAGFAIVLLPRQFHVSVVENADPGDIRRARWLFPLYLVAINIFVIPIAIAGLLVLPPGADGDTFVLALPVSEGSAAFAMIAFIGGLSASTAMVIVETIALSIMVCNNLALPLLLRQHGERQAWHRDMSRLLIVIRRAAIAVVLVLAYSYYWMIGSTAALAQVGLISFAAVAQFAPAFFGGLVWKRATARGASAGILVGFLIWAYTLLLPSFADAGWIGRSFIDDGAFGLGFLRPRMLFHMEFDPLTHGVLWSLIANVVCLAGFSLTRAPSPIERIQAAGFIARDLQVGSGGGFRLWRTAINAARLEETVARYLGAGRARAAFAEFFAQRGQEPNPAVEADVRMLRFAEHLLASAVGAASSRLVMALMLERHSTATRGAMKLLDDASAAIQYNRDLLQSAIDNVGQGIAVFDADMALVCWNRGFEDQLPVSAELARVGAPLREIAADFLRSTDSGTAGLDGRIASIAALHEPFRERLAGDGRVIEVRSSPMPDGGVVATFTDVTGNVRAADALRKANESLERRVAERTAELTRLNAELETARSSAEAANLGKTRFIAAASHDILQPLNAARLFTSSMVEKFRRSSDAELVRNVDASLEAVEEILSVLLDISRLDAGVMKPEPAPFRIGDILQALALEFGPAARAKGLELTVMPCTLTVETDRKLLRRVLQNLVSNAIKYTRRGRVLMGCRHGAGVLRIEVHDTGPGIAEDQRGVIFEEFRRLGGDDGGAAGLGLGLSIVDRIAKVIGSRIILRSEPGRGSMFAVEVPLADIQLAAEPTRPSPPPRRGLAGMESILVIDNEPAILDGMELLLRGWGCRVYKALDGEAADRAFTEAQGRIDIVLADYHLGRGDGIAVVGALRRKAKRHIPAVLITADRSRKVADAATAHAIHLLRKPVKPAALRAAMSHVAAAAEAAE